jgi:hypothetical protein
MLLDEGGIEKCIRNIPRQLSKLWPFEINLTAKVPSKDFLAAIPTVSPKIRR